jgi:hypothetical protein
MTSITGYILTRVHFQVSCVISHFFVKTLSSRHGMFTNYSASILWFHESTHVIFGCHGCRIGSLVLCQSRSFPRLIIHHVQQLPALQTRIDGALHHARWMARSALDHSEIPGQSLENHVLINAGDAPPKR